MCEADYATTICLRKGAAGKRKQVCAGDLSISAVLLIQAALCGALLLEEITAASISLCRRLEK